MQLLDGASYLFPPCSQPAQMDRWYAALPLIMGAHEERERYGPNGRHTRDPDMEATILLSV
jgi:hypothetical protein